MFNFTKKYDFIKEEIKNIPEVKNKKLISKSSALKEFIRRTGYAIKLALTEKEIFTFALLQLITIVLVYYLWVQFLGWIPEEVWNNEEKLSNLALNLVFLLWSFLCVGLAAFPLGILSGCIGAAHFLRKQGKKSTIATCLKMILPRAKELWIFSWADGWFTVNRILDRLPKKRWRWNVAEEILYFAWKVATVGMLPSIIVGRKIIESGKEAINFVLKRTSDVLVLRIGYSFLCWIVGISAYIGSIFFFIKFNNLFDQYPGVFGFYMLIGIPIAISVAVILFFLRPIYVISCCDVFTDYVNQEKIKIQTPDATSTQNVIVAFAVLVIIILFMFFFREQIGIMDIIRSLM